MAPSKGAPSAADLRTAVSVYERHKGMMLKTAMTYNDDLSAAEDIVHDAVLCLAENGPVLRTLSDASRARYAKVIVRAVAVDRYRKQRRERARLSDAEPESLTELPSPVTPEDSLIRRDADAARLRNLYEALAEMEPAQRKLLIDKYIVGVSDEALARQLGVKTASVRMLLTRARRKAKELIERKEGSV